MKDNLQDSESKIRLLVDKIQDVFWITTPTLDQIIYISPRYETLWGRSCESLYKQPIFY